MSKNEKLRHMSKYSDRKRALNHDGQKCWSYNQLKYNVISDSSFSRDH